jgi:hypothetical protein
MYGRQTKLQINRDLEYKNSGKDPVKRNYSVQQRWWSYCGRVGRVL